MLPWMTSEHDATQAVMGTDFWPYGLEANRGMLETQIRWSCEQGLIPVPLKLGDLFLTAT
jgi:4,5-dihydroxyphthalate decarboxylase